MSTETPRLALTLGLWYMAPSRRLWQFPLHMIPLQRLPLHMAPLHVVPLHVVPLHVVPLHVVPLHMVPLHVVPLHMVPLHTQQRLVMLPAHQVCLATVLLVSLSSTKLQCQGVMQELDDLTGSPVIEAAGQRDCSPAGQQDIVVHRLHNKLSAAQHAGITAFPLIRLMLAGSGLPP